MPPLIGYAAASGLLNWEAGVLYAILFLWQFPHFYAIAWMYRDDYARAGIRMLPVVEPSNESTSRRIVWCSLVLIPISLLPKYFDMVGHYYVYGAVAVGLYYLLRGRARFRMTARCRGPVRCCSRAWFIFRCFMASWCSTAFATSAVCGALVLAGCSGKPPLPAYGVVPDFTLTDQNGAAFQSTARLNKKVWVADFIFTNCPGPCPRMSSQMHQVQAALDGNDAVRFVSFTVDPARDTPPVLAAYAKHFEAAPGKVVFPHRHRKPI